MKVLIGCEESQEVCKAFRELGFEAYSNDLVECSGGKTEWHLRMNVFQAIEMIDPILFIGHPPCTFMCNSGVRWLNIENGFITNKDRENYLVSAMKFFNDLKNLEIEYIALENPIPHKYARDGFESRYHFHKSDFNEGIGNYDQIIHPYQFGHPEQKSTCLWLKNLPKLKPTNLVDGREQKVWKMPPGPDRAKNRSKTYPGIAKAMAEQWGKYIMENNSLKKDTTY